MFDTMHSKRWQITGWLFLPLFVLVLLCSAAHLAEHGAHDDDCIACHFHTETPTQSTSTAIVHPPSAFVYALQVWHSLPISAPIATLHLAPSHSPPA